MSLEEFFTKFQSFESNKKLFDIKINDISIWEFIRFTIFIKLRKELVSDHTEVSNKSVKKGIKGLNEYLRNVYLKKTNTKIEKTEILILNSPRRKYEEGLFLDIYTDTFLPHIPFEYKVAERFFNLGHLRPAPTKNLIYLDKIEFPLKLLNYVPFSEFSKISDLAAITKLQDDINHYWGVQISNIPDIIKEYIRRYKYTYPRMKALIRKMDPKIIVVVVSYSFFSQMAIIIAKELGIPTAEIQHGTMGNLHIAYNYPPQIKVDSFPDFLLSWGKYWTQNAQLPISDKKVIEVGFPYIENYNKNLLHVEKKANQIIIISQLREDIAKFTFELADLLPEYDFIFKAHPREYSNAHVKYSFLIEKQNIKIIVNDEISLYTLFSESNYVIGVSSTAIIEAIAFRCNILLVQLSGWEYFKNIDNRNGVQFVRSAEEAKENIVKNNSADWFQNLDIDYFFKGNSVQNITDFFSSKIIL